MNAQHIVAMYAVFDQDGALRDAADTNNACSVGELKLLDKR
jgi:hypothetical protein